MQLSHLLHCYHLRSLFILSWEQSLLWPRQECWIWMDCCLPPASQFSNICHCASQSFQTEIQRKQTCKTAIYVDWPICFPRGIQSRGTDNANNVLQTTLPMPGRKGHVTEYQKQLNNRTLSEFKCSLKSIKSWSCTKVMSRFVSLLGQYILFSLQYMFEYIFI